MALKFLDGAGKGLTGDAVKSMNYAIAMGAKHHGLGDIGRIPGPVSGGGLDVRFGWLDFLDGFAGCHCWVP